MPGRRTILMTGGNSGVGYAASAALVASDDGPWHLILACRDTIRAEQAVTRLSHLIKDRGHTVETMRLDLAHLNRVRSFAERIAHQVAIHAIPPLAGIICNAGVQAGATMTTTTDGFESTFAINHLGHFLLVKELMPTLKAPARVVVVSSDTHDPGNGIRMPVPAWNDNVIELAHGKLGTSADRDRSLVAGQRRYSTSKLANLYFTYGLARRLPRGITANAFNPGLVLGTRLQRSAPPLLRFVGQHLLPRIPALQGWLTSNVRTAEDAGEALAWLTTSPAVADVTGKYFDGRQPIESSAESRRDDRAETLWRESEALIQSRSK